MRAEQSIVLYQILYDILFDSNLDIEAECILLRYISSTPIVSDETFFKALNYILKYIIKEKVKNI